jgi:hypothetical protein
VLLPANVIDDHRRTVASFVSNAGIGLYGNRDRAAAVNGTLNLTHLGAGSATWN